jgi:hypothetical protein
MRIRGVLNAEINEPGQHAPGDQRLRARFCEIWIDYINIMGVQRGGGANYFCAAFKMQLTDRAARVSAFYPLAK